jgi:hypothetical protein
MEGEGREEEGKEKEKRFLMISCLEREWWVIRSDEVLRQ